MLKRLLLLCALVAPAFSASPSTSAAGFATADDDVDAAAKTFRRNVRGDSLESRKEALIVFTEVTGEDGIPHLLVEYVRAHRKREEAEYAFAKFDVNLRARKRVVADLELRSERDESLKKVVKAQKRDLEFKEVDLKINRETVELESAWCVSLSGTIEAQLDAAGSNVRKRNEKELWKDLDKSPEPQVQLAAVDLLGRIGSPGTAVKLQRALVDAESARLKAQKKLPRLEKEVRKFEEVLQKDSAANGGRVNGSLAQQYEGVRVDAERMRKTATFAAKIAVACSEAATIALDREEGEGRTRALGDLEKALGRTDGVARQLTLRILAASGGEPIRNKLRLLLRSEKDPGVAANLVDDLCTMGDKALAPILIESYLGHENWHLAARAIAGLATLRSKEAVPVMISMLESAEGRAITDLRAALRSLTGKRFRTAVLWQRFWEAEGEAFVIPDQEVTMTEEQAEREQLGTTFFGVSTESTRIVFVLDLSGSMNFSMVTRSGFSDGTPDMPRRGERSRLDVAKTELKKAVSALPDGAVFNIVLYASSAWTWKKKLVTMDTELRTEAQDFIDNLTAVGGTNIYGAISEAFIQADVDPSGEWPDPAVDTIFLLSDGQPSMGTSTDPDTILSMAREFNAAAGIVIHTIGLSGAQDAYLMRNLAEQNKGIYTAR